MPVTENRTVSGDASAAPWTASPAAVVLLGLWLGLLYGYVEGIEVLAVGRVPGALSWRTGNSAHIIWFAPIFYGAVGLLLSLPFAVLRAAGIRREIDAAMVFLYVLGGAFLAGTLVGSVIADWAVLALAAGIAVQATRLYRQWIRSRAALVRRGAPLMILGIPACWLLVSGTMFLRERLAMRALAAPAAGRPNVLVLVLDTQRADHLSSYGYERPTTPRMDRLAAQGVLFENAFAPSSWTLPTHASLFTGRYPQEHRAGVIRRPWIDGRFPTLAEVLRASGYATGGFVANGFWCGRQTRLHRGFIRYEDFYHSLGDAVARTSLGRRLAYDYGPRLGFIDVPGRKRAELVNAQFLGWLNQVGDRPFFAFLNYFDVHGPLLPPAPYAGRFSGRAATPKSDEIQIGALTGDMPRYTPEAIRILIDAYDESLLYLDAQIGALMDSLELRGALENTLVVITSDHGESFGEHGMMFHGHSMYRDQLAVPLILRLPGRISAGLRVKGPVGIEQIPATVLQLAGRTADGFPGAALPLSGDVVDSSQVVIGGVGRRSLVPADWPSSRGWVSSLVTPRFHFILNEDGTSHLFDLADVREERDLGVEPGYSDSVSALTLQVADLWERPARPASTVAPPAAASAARGVAAGLARRQATP
jgi:arylsulfatase A-like enzyme